MIDRRFSGPGIGVSASTGATGPVGPTGPPSTIPGPTGATGPISTIPGPTGATGPAGINATVTVALSMPPTIFSVSGSPVGNSGTISVSMVTQNANLVM